MTPEHQSSKQQEDNKNLRKKIEKLEKTLELQRKTIEHDKKFMIYIMTPVDNIYLGNPDLKKANTQIEFTQEQILEFVACRHDPVYFAKKYIKIVSLDEGLVNFNLYPFQEKLVKNFHENRFNICKMPRQTGKSTTCVSYLLHYAVFNDNVNIAILANKASTARELLGRLQLAYENLPKWMNKVYLHGTKDHWN